jgi:hypothetical protein
VDKFRDKNGTWREKFQRVEEDMPKFAVSYTVQDKMTETGKVKF